MTGAEQCHQQNYCATSTYDGTDQTSYQTYAYCGYGNNNENKCIPMIYSGVEYQNCTEKSTSGWCATSVYSSLSYYSLKYCTKEDWLPPPDLRITSCGPDGCSTVTGETCVPFTYGGVEHEYCTDEVYSWCATSTNSDGSYNTWAYCGFGDSTGDDCTYPWNYTIGTSSSTFYSCTQNTRNGWCPTSVYANTREPYTTKDCLPKDYFAWEKFYQMEYYWDHVGNGIGITHKGKVFDYSVYGGNGTDTTVDGQYCVPWVYNGENLTGCTEGGYAWCATSTYDTGAYKTWAYCGYGDSNGDSCIFPFRYGDLDYNTCYNGWCATSIYKNERYYYSYKNCNEEELALGMTQVTFGSGTTVTGEKCVPMIYSYANFTACSSTDYYSWCATSTYDDGNYKTYAYCGIQGANSGEDCVFPFIYDNKNYTTCTDQYSSSSSRWCATAVYDFGNYYEYKYCSEDDIKLGYTEIDEYELLQIKFSSSETGEVSHSYDNSTLKNAYYGSTVTNETCTPMIYQGVHYLNCLHYEHSFCATSVDEDTLSYKTYAYCGFGDEDADEEDQECIFPFKYYGVEYNECATVYGDTTPYCAVSTYLDGEYSSLKKCNARELRHSGLSKTLGSGRTVNGEACVPFVYQGVVYEQCTDDATYDWCATAVNDNDEWTSWGYCGYGTYNGETCVPMYYGGVYYQNCTTQDSSGWCATSAYGDLAANRTGSYNTHKYCEVEDWTYNEEEYICEECDTTVHGEYCTAMTYNGIDYEGCTDDDSYAWCATSVDSSNNYVTWDYCGYGDADEENCYYPFKTSSSYGIWYETCTSKVSGTGWCATSTYNDGLYYSWKYCDDDELDLGRTTAEYGEGTTVTGEECVPMVYSGVYYTKCTYEEYSWCATSTYDSGSYKTWAYCGYGDSDEDECVYPFIYNGETLTECADQSSSNPWCATSVYEETLSYYTWKYCDADDLGGSESAWGSSTTSEGCVFPFSYNGVTYLECTYVGGGGSAWCATTVNEETGNYITWQYCAETTTTSTTESLAGSMQTFSGESCVPMIYGGVYYDACTSDSQAWCATSTDSDLAYQTWGYCMLGDGNNCYFPFKTSASSNNYYECADKSSYSGYGWCATSTYTNGVYHDWKYCDASDTSISASADGSGTTVTGEYCVAMTYGGVDYEGCTSDYYSWCATSTYDSGSYKTWAYCGYGNSNEDECAYPFEYNGVSYTTCTDQTSSGWCATSVYETAKTYYSWKYCDEDDKALGVTSVSYGEGTTVEAQSCVPMIYGGVQYEACTADTYSWCATETNDDGSYTSWQYCGYGDSNEYNCVPMTYSGVDYEACTEKSTSGWCATSAYENTRSYYSWKYCEESDWDTESTTSASSSGSSSGTGTTVTGEDCVSMTYGGVEYEGCTSEDKYGWCATSTYDSGSYKTWAYCGYGDSYGDQCYYPFYYNGATYYECAGSSGNEWCATSVYQSTYDYYSYKSCDATDLGEDSSIVSKTFDGDDCVPMIYNNARYSGCKDEGSYSWCATSTNSYLAYVTWDYCGYGSEDSDDCVYPFNYAGQTYYECADKSSSPWCATSTYLSGNYKTWKYCDSDDLTSGSSGSSGSNSESDGDSGNTKTVSGEDCVLPFSYKGKLYYECTTKDFGSIPWCATSVDSDYSVKDWNYCKSSSSSSSSTGSSSSSSGSSSGSSSDSSSSDEEGR